MISSASFMLYRKWLTMPLNDLIVTRAVWTGGRKCPPAHFIIQKMLDPAVDQSYRYPSSLDRREKVPTGSFSILQKTA